MGITLWLLCGIAVFAAARSVAAGRPASIGGELAIALASAFLAGLAATAFDFGGWAVLDWRAGLFTFLSAIAAAGLYRLTRVVSGL